MTLYPTFTIPVESARPVGAAAPAGVGVPGITVSGEASAISMVDMGITHDMYRKLQKVCTEHHCIIMIRKTNKGSVMPFDQGVAVGKKLATKGKSSNAHFTKGNITFFAQMAKSLDPAEWLKQQSTLIGVLGERATNGTDPKYAYIPKLLTTDKVQELLAVEGVTVWGRIGDAEIVVSIPADDLSGIGTLVNYKLVKTSWAELNVDGAEFKDKLVRPVPGEGDLDLYRVYVEIKIEHETAWPIPLFFDYTGVEFITKVEEADLKPNHGIVAEEGITIETKEGKRIFQFSSFPKVMSKKLWELKQGFPEQNTGRLLEKCAPQLPTDGSFREVRVLALFTRGGKFQQAADQAGNTARGSGENKKFFEVVADYDLFMVSPDLGSGKFNITVDNVFYITRKKKKVRPEDAVAAAGVPEIAEELELSLLPKAGSKRIREGGKEKKINPYGLLSDYEMFIRKEVNDALEIKVAQHGIETCNLFYTSDIADPVLVIFPDMEKDRPLSSQKVIRLSAAGPAQPARPSSASAGRMLAPLANYSFKRDENTVSTGLCFFASFRMLFEMMLKKTGKIERVIRDKEELNTTFNIDPEYAVQDAQYLFTNRYPMIFNLNWGSADYKAFHKITDERQKEINAQVLPLPGGQYEQNALNRHFNGLFSTTNFNISGKPLSLQMLYLYLYQSSEIIKENPPMYDLAGNRRKVLTFLQLFYNQVLSYLGTPESDPDWPGLYGGAGKSKEKITNVRAIYEEAVTAIRVTLAQQAGEIPAQVAASTRGARPTTGLALLRAKAAESRPPQLNPDE